MPAAHRPQAAGAEAGRSSLSGGPCQRKGCPSSSESGQQGWGPPPFPTLCGTGLPREKRRRAGSSSPPPREARPAAQPRSHPAGRWFPLVPKEPLEAPGRLVWGAFLLAISGKGRLPAEPQQRVLSPKPAPAAASRRSQQEPVQGRSHRATVGSCPTRHSAVQAASCDLTVVSPLTSCWGCPGLSRAGRPCAPSFSLRDINCSA